MDRKHLDDLHELQASESMQKIMQNELEYSMKWYGWGSPIGLSIFFLTIVLIAAIIKIVFFG
jgi:hypothetical protein